MDENLIGYLLNALDAEGHREVEALLATDPAARDRLETLRRALEPLASDRDEFEPPAGLAMRTLDRIAALAPPAPPALPRAPAVRSLGVVPPFWRRADFLIAASLLLTILGVGIPWVISSRREAARVACTADMERSYVDHLKPHSDMHAGWFPRKLPRAVNVSAHGYGYSLGHRAGNVVVGPRFEQEKPNFMLALMGDGPPPDAVCGNSPNHGGDGQNVLFQDGHVKYCTLRTVGVDGDDVYVNWEHKVAPGRDWKDSVIGIAMPNP